MSKDNQKIFPKKWSKLLPMGWDEIIQSSKTEDLQKLIYDCEANIYVIDQSKEEDQKLQSIRDELRQAVEPYTDAKKTQTAKIKYMLFLLEERGVDLDKSSD